MISKEKKAEIIKTYGRTPEDTGSPEVRSSFNSTYLWMLNEQFKRE